VNCRKRGTAAKKHVVGYDSAVTCFFRRGGGHGVREQCDPQRAALPCRLLSGESLNATKQSSKTNALLII